MAELNLDERWWDRDSLAGLHDSAVMTVASGPGLVPEAWRHVALGVWIAPPGSLTEDLHAEQMTVGQIRAQLRALTAFGGGAAIDEIIDGEFPPGSDERARLDAAAEDARRLLTEHGYADLLGLPPGGADG
jgi:hypothetical protein